MPAKKPFEVLSHDIAQVVKYHYIDHNTLQETADLIGVSRRTVIDIKRTETYHDLCTQALQELDEPVKNFAKDLVDTKNDKSKENRYLRWKAIEKGLNIYGVEPPKEEKHIHSFDNMTDEEIKKQVEASIIEDSPALPRNAEAITGDTASPEQSGVVGEQPQAGTGDSPKE